MAITSISRIQHRRGLKTDLPTNLAEGEFGWCLDTRELYIGNGPGYGLNTQILTQYTNNDLAIQHTYVGSSGIPARSIGNLSTIRPIGKVLDDAVSVKDYGAIGDGIADDTAAINQAIYDRYGSSTTSGVSQLTSRPTLYFPAGRYRITNKILLMPFVSLIGDGMSNSEIYMDNASAACVIETADSLLQTEANIGLDGARLPSYIHLESMLFTTSSTTGDVFRLIRGDHISMTNVAFDGPWISGNGAAILTSGIKIRSIGASYPCQYITIIGCKFSGTVNGISCTDVDDFASMVSINSCEFNGCYKGISGNSTFTMSGISSSSFVNLDNNGIYTASSDSITSCSNRFDNIALISGTYAIYWDTGTTKCSSIGDTFGPSISPTNSVYDGNAGHNMIINSPNGGGGGGGTAVNGPVTLLDNQSSYVSAGISFNLDQTTAMIIDYSMIRGGSRRLGRLQIITDGNTASIADSGNDLSGSTGILWSYTITGISPKTLTITYASTSTGVNASMKYTTLAWLA